MNIKFLLGIPYNATPICSITKYSISNFSYNNFSYNNKPNFTYPVFASSSYISFSIIHSRSSLVAASYPANTTYTLKHKFSILWQSNFHQGFIIFFAQKNTYRRIFILQFFIAIVIIHIHLHLSNVLMCQLIHFQINQNITPKKSIVEN